MENNTKELHTNVEERTKKTKGGYKRNYKKDSTKTKENTKKIDTGFIDLGLEGEKVKPKEKKDLPKEKIVK